MRMGKRLIGVVAASFIGVGSAISGTVVVGSMQETKVEAASQNAFNPTAIQFNKVYSDSFSNTSSVKTHYYLFKTNSKGEYTFQFNNLSEAKERMAQMEYLHVEMYGRKNSSSFHRSYGVFINEHEIKRYNLEANTEYIIKVEKKGTKYTIPYKFKVTAPKDISYPCVQNYKGTWTYFNKNKKADYTYTGVAKSTTGNWVFVKNGKFYTGYTGVAKSTTGNWVYVKKGRYYTGATGVARSTTGNYVYVKNGRYYTKYTGLTKSLTTCRLVYVKNGRWQKNYSGIVKYNGKTYSVKNGIAK